MAEREIWPEFEASLGLRMRTSNKTLTKKKTKSKQTGVSESFSFSSDPLALPGRSNCYQLIGSPFRLSPVHYAVFVELPLSVCGPP